MIISFYLEREEFHALRELAEGKGLDINSYAKNILNRYLSKVSKAENVDSYHDKRAHPRAKVSISGVSCVNISDKELRSYPVVVEDISKGGIRISFKKSSSDLVRKLSNVSSFEVVFTIPQQSQIVSLSCKCLRHYVSENVSIVGTFEGNDDNAITMVDSMVKDSIAH